MRTRHTTAAAAVLLLTLTACGTSDTTTTDAPGNEAERDAMREEARKKAGLPPSPEPTQRQAYLDALNAIDPDIVHGKGDKAVSRGLSQCQSIKQHPNERAKQIDLATKWFTSPTHPEGRTSATAEKILDVVHKHICPDF
jgi:hypothetical protein